ncbi:MAG: ATP-dependent DNA helicase [Actinobacteria bacterium]|nr:ATP-dependent DNA helicase [Actinomycetota bacterium]MCL5447395.1 ATP-dependent DNA helicase [Actinomycetota bacterium]
MDPIAHEAGDHPERPAQSRHGYSRQDRVRQTQTREDQSLHPPEPLTRETHARGIHSPERFPDALATKTKTILLGLRKSLGSDAEDRPGQVQMAQAVSRIIEEGGVLVAQAGTGTGKSFAYLAPIIAAGRKAVIATATIALQNQLASKDLPALTKLFPDLTFAVLKGRSNYMCLAKYMLHPQDGPNEQGSILEPPNDRPRYPKVGTPPETDWDSVSSWARTTRAGDRDELGNISPAIWSEISSGSDECPGAYTCSIGRECFAEKARRNAESAGIVITNLHLYGLHIKSSGNILPDHDIAVLDEAHETADILIETFGVELRPSQVERLARLAERITEGNRLGRRRTSSPLEPAPELHDAIQRVRIASRSLDDALHDLLDRSGNPSGAVIKGGVESGSALDSVLRSLQDAVTDIVAILSQQLRSLRGQIWHDQSIPAVSGNPLDFPANTWATPAVHGAKGSRGKNPSRSGRRDVAGSADHIERIIVRGENILDAIGQLTSSRDGTPHRILLVEPVSTVASRAPSAEPYGADYRIRLLYLDIGEVLSEWLWPAMEYRNDTHANREAPRSTAPGNHLFEEQVLSTRQESTGPPSRLRVLDTDPGGNDIGLERSLAPTVVHRHDTKPDGAVDAGHDGHAGDNGSHSHAGNDEPAGSESAKGDPDEWASGAPAALIMVSATVPPGMVERLSLPRPAMIDAGTPFDFASQALLYVPPAPFPLPNSKANDATALFYAACEEELITLVIAAGGRTLALFTSYASMRRAVETMRTRLPGSIEILSQDDHLSRNALVDRFIRNEQSCLLATRSYFQGVDVPGPSLSLVVLDKLPFPSPADPVIQARRDIARERGENAFMSVDIPAAATLLAQATGRLLRRASDTGAVAVLDRRITDAPYSSVLLSHLPFPKECLVRQKPVAVKWLEAIKASRDNANKHAGNSASNAGAIRQDVHPPNC